MLKDFVAVSFVGDVETDTYPVKLNEPDADGVPEIAPELALKERPVGSVPVFRLQV